MKYLPLKTGQLLDLKADLEDKIPIGEHTIRKLIRDCLFYRALEEDTDLLDDFEDDEKGFEGYD